MKFMSMAVKTGCGAVCQGRGGGAGRDVNGGMPEGEAAKNRACSCNWATKPVNRAARCNLTRTIVEN
jgi:hypothetical protein